MEQKFVRGRCAPRCATDRSIKLIVPVCLERSGDGRVVWNSQEGRSALDDASSRSSVLCARFTVNDEINNSNGIIRGVIRTSVEIEKEQASERWVRACALAS